MKSEYIKSFRNLAISFNKFINNYGFFHCKRIRKTSVIDAFAYKLLQGQIDMSGPKACYKLNKFRNTAVTRSSLAERAKSIPLSFYKDAYEFISNKLAFITSSKNKRSTYEIIAVDGTQINLNKHLSKDGLHLNKNSLSVNGFILGVYNVTYGTPISLNLMTHKNERKALLEYLHDNNCDPEDNYIYVLDRGYYSNDLVKTINEKCKYLCRLRHNLNIIPKTCDDQIVDDNGLKIRIVTYTINGVKYYLGTNLLNKNEFPIDILKELYHKRWMIEECFKYFKTNMDLNKINEKTSDDIQKHLYCHLIVRKLVDGICLTQPKPKHKYRHIGGKSNDKTKKIINKAVLTKAIYDDFVLQLIYKSKIGEKSIRKFINLAVVFTNTHHDVSNPRVSSLPYSKWYVKKYYHKYVLEGKKGYHSKMALRESAIREA